MVLTIPALSFMAVGALRLGFWQVQADRQWTVAVAVVGQAEEARRQGRDDDAEFHLLMAMSLLDKNEKTISNMHRLIRVFAWVFLYMFVVFVVWGVADSRPVTVVLSLVLLGVWWRLSRPHRPFSRES